MKKRFLFCVVGIFLSMVIQRHCNAEETLDLEELIQEALTKNPEVGVLQGKTSALWERPSQARSWEDPKLTFGVTNLPVDDFDFNKQDMTQKTVSISQQVPFPGIKSLKGRVAVEEAKGAEQELEQAKTSIVREVKKAYFELYFVNESLKITEANEDLLKQFVEFIQIKYELGKGLQEDILKARVELYKLQEKLITLNQARTTIQAQLCRLLNRDVSMTLSGTPLLKSTEFSFTPEELEALALENNPALKALQHGIERSEAEHSLARKQYVPQFTISASYGQRDNRLDARPFPAKVTNAADGSSNNVIVTPLSDDRHRPDFFSFLVGVNIPLWFKSKQSKRVAETYHRISQTRSQYESMKNDIFFLMRDYNARVARNRDLVHLYRDSIIPQATQALDADIVAYQVAKIDFLTLLTSQVTLFNYEIEYHRVMKDYEKDLAELEAVVGKRIF